MSINMQLTTFANTSAPSSLVIAASSAEASSSSLAFSRSKSSIGIPPGRELTIGKRPGAPKVNSFERRVATSGALASVPINFFKFVSRSFLFFLENMDLMPRPPRFLGAADEVESAACGVGVVGAVGATSAGFSPLAAVSSTSSSSSSTSSAVSMSPSIESVAVVSMAPEVSGPLDFFPSLSPMSRLNCFCRSFSSAALG
mmetsp:Transcript_15191/g.25240  ORF Transcript_15191/g.25240 Transcript_15191/m.25240 type:complete len:200 (+) Transcript_15191:793-1392(+)